MMRYAQASAWVNDQAEKRNRPVPGANLRDATIVFDLDGTLVDTLPDLANALNDVLTRRGHAAVAPDAVRAEVGLGARAMIEGALRREGMSGDVDQMLAEFITHYEANIAAESRPYPGAVASLEQLSAAGARLALCTNKRAFLTRKLLSALRLDHYFQGVAGRDTFAVAKPDPGHLTGTIALAGGEPTRAIMVGDSEVDLRAAKGAGVPIVLVSFGYGPSPLLDLAPDAIIDHFDELVPHAARLLTGAPRRRVQP
jgi:phosphoglycolate phosphatase